MGRAERRRQQRDLNQNVATIHKLDAKELKLVAAMVEEKVGAEKYRIHKDLFMYCGYALMKYFVEEETAVNVVTEISKLLKQDDVKKVEKEFKEMANVKELIMKFFEDNKGLSKKEAIAEAVIKFPRSSKNSILRYYHDWNKENNQAVENEDDPDVVEAMEKVSEILDMGKDIESEKVLKEADQAATEAEKELIKEVKKVEEPVVKSKEEVIVCGLKVIEEKVVKSIKVEGENGYYEGTTEKGVVLTRNNNSIWFQDVQCLDEWVKEFKQVFEMVK